ncbi:hypothetical protein FJZ33_12230 [Candidatus Poribacteria bacterium]|nr:hypothetical protein [Candidatus Poribacteria bacterium]
MFKLPVRKTKYLIILLFLLHLIPIWAFKFIPSQDGLNHVYNAYILKEYNNSEYTKFREVYSLNIKPFPNWGAHAFFYVAIYLMPFLVAEKIFVTICIVLVPLGFYYFLKQVDKNLVFFSLLGFLYSYNHFISLGFYGFALSFSIYFFALGYWWKYREQISLKHALILNLLIGIIYFSHMFSFAMILLSISLLAFTSFVLPGSDIPTTKKRAIIFIYNIAILIPSYTVLLYLLINNPESQERNYQSFKELWQFFISVGSILSFNDRGKLLIRILVGLIGFCFLWKAIRDKIIERKFLNHQDGFLILFYVSMILYFKMPWQVGPPAWINPRMYLFLFPLLLAWFSTKYPIYLKYSLIGIMLILSLTHLVMKTYDYHLLNKDMKEFTSGAHLITPNSAISIIGDDSLETEHHGKLKYASPFYHDTCYYCLGNGSHYAGNYEPKYSYFPLRYREGYWKFEYKGIIDYILVWQTGKDKKEYADLKENKNYQLIHETKNLKIYKYNGPR